MVPALTSYFAAMAEAGATLFGLLFVAISIRRAGGDDGEASVEEDILADAVLFSLANGFAISASALVPGLNLGYVALPMGAAGVLEASRVGARLLRAWRREPIRHPFADWVRVLFPTGCALAIVVIQLDAGARVLLDPGGEVPYRWLAMTVLGCYGVSLVRSWMLIGGATSGLRAVITNLKRPGTGT